MSIENFIPKIWSDKIFQSYDKAFVFGNLANRSYEGAIRNFGDQVKISELGDFTATAYTGSTLTYNTPQDASKYLLINQKYAIAVKLDDIDNAQSNPKLMGEITRKMGIGFSDNVDQYIAGLYTEAGIEGVAAGGATTGSPLSITTANVTSVIRDIGTSLSENNVPQQGRVAVIPPWLHAKLDLTKVVRDTNNSFILNDAYIGRYMGFDLFASNNVSHSGSTWYTPMFFSAADTIAFAEQMMKMEVLRDKDTFDDYMRGLIVYGAKVVRPSSLATVYVAEGSETTI